MVFMGGGVQLPVINTHTPSRHCSCRDKSPFFIFHHCYPGCLGHYLSWTDPCSISNWINDTSIQKLQDFILHHLFHCRVQSLLGVLRGTTLSSKFIWWEQIKGLIPFMSVIVQPNADLCSRNMLTNCCSCDASSLDEMMTGKVLPAPRKTGFRPLGNWAILTFGVSIVEGFRFSLSWGNYSKQGCQNLSLLPCEFLEMVMLFTDSIGLEFSDLEFWRRSSRSSKLLSNLTSSGISVSIRNVYWKY